MFTFKLIQTDGTPTDPPQFVTAVPNWHKGDTFLLRREEDDGAAGEADVVEAVEVENRHALLMLDRGQGRFLDEREGPESWRVDRRAVGVAEGRRRHGRALALSR